jgi:hypothetical protein
LVLLPKCPLCLAAWLTVATGVTFTASGAAWVRASIVILCVVALYRIGAQVLRPSVLLGNAAFVRLRRHHRAFRDGSRSPFGEVLSNRP